MSSEIRSIKSINIGINLNAQLQPLEAGIISVNTEKYKSGDLFDRLLRGEIMEDKLNCLAPLIPIKKGISNEKIEAMTYALLNGIDEIFKNSIKKWQPVIRKYLSLKTDFLNNLLPELSFYTASTILLKKLKEKNLPLCKPKLFPKEDKIFNVNGLYNPLCAIKTEDKMILNDFTFDENGQIYVLTGANRGGKSIFTYAVGIAQTMLQLGLYIPAEYAEISPIDNILTHFPVSDENASEGRLGEECLRLSKLFDNVTKYSLVLMDETMSSTGSYEGSYIAGEVLTGFSIAECRCIFTTHLHELASNVDALNEKNAILGAKSKIDTLIVGVVGEERDFKIYRTKPEGISHAISIAEKYGITADKLKAKIEAAK
jgi:DNA mismatch repair ATPase MutS